MMLRRAFLWWQFAAVLILPLFVFLSRGVVGAQLGWDVVLSLVAAPVLGAAVLIVAILTVIRPSVLVTKAVSWFDVAVLVCWHGAVIWFCLQPTAWLFGLIVLAAFVAFWGAIWQLVTDTSRRVTGAVRDFTVEFDAAVSERRRGAPIDLGELRPIAERTAERDGEGPRRSVAE